MPIDRTQFDEVKRPLTERIMAVLREAPDQALNISELIAACEHTTQQQAEMDILLSKMGGTQSGLVSRYQGALHTLLNAGDIERAHYQGADYFMAART